MSQANMLPAGTADSPTGGAGFPAASPSARPPVSRSLRRFLIIGVLSFGVDAGTLFIAHGVLRIWLPLATAIAYGVAFVVNFGLNRIWSFASTGRVAGQVSRYIVLIGVNYVITVAIVTGLAAAGLQYMLAKVVAAAVAAVINYIACRSWVFADGLAVRPAPRAAPPPPRSARRWR